MQFDNFFYRAMMMSEGWQFNSKRDCTLLALSPPNAKIDQWQLNLPAGYTCPFASDCRANANKYTGKIEEPKKGDEGFRCYAASQEAIYPKTRASRHNNFDLLLSKKTQEEITQLIIDSLENQLPRNQRIFRIHSSGDFFSQKYFNAWVEVANHFSDIIFYAYTKSLPYWIRRKKELPSNMILTASKGGKDDKDIDLHDLKFSAVVFSEKDAEEYPLSPYWQKTLGRTKGLPLDHDDTHAFRDGNPFALLLHGIQPKGTKAGEAFRALAGSSGYSKKSKDN